jgi:hypothetical protein
MTIGGDGRCHSRHIVFTHQGDGRAARLITCRFVDSLACDVQHAPSVIRTTKEQRSDMLAAAHAFNVTWNEKAWTLLVADALDQAPDQRTLCQQLCGNAVPVRDHLDVWFGAQPRSTWQGIRGEGEGRAKLDLAFGNALQQQAIQPGREPEAHDASWVCFVDAKCLADSGTGVAFDPTRNQLTRAIENALCFETASGLPRDVYFTLLTPRLFKDDAVGVRSRLYAFKMAEYQADPEALLRDIRGCALPARFGQIDIEERLAALRLNWVTFETLLEPSVGLDLDVIRRPSGVGDLSERVYRAASRLVADPDVVASDDSAG